MSGKITASRYARALFETALEKNVMETVSKDILNVEKILNEIPETRKYCREYHAERNEEIEFVKTAFIPYVSELTEKLILAAVKNRRLSSLPLFPSAFREISDNASGRINVILETAKEPEDSFIKKIALGMEKRTGKKIAITKSINPDLIGGFRIIWRNRILDMSASGRLRKMRELLSPA